VHAHGVRTSALTLGIVQDYEPGLGAARPRLGSGGFEVCDLGPRSRQIIRLPVVSTRPPAHRGV
jgi:hypothetical protein